MSLDRAGLIGPAVWLAAVGGAALRAADYPSAVISNGDIRAKVYLPDAKRGFYTSTRFDWSGAVSSRSTGATNTTVYGSRRPLRTIRAAAPRRTT